MQKESIIDPIIDRSTAVVTVETVSRKKTPHHPSKGYHHHDSYQLVIVERGIVEFILNGMLHQMDKGKIIMIGSKLPHGTVNFSHDVRATIIHIPYDNIIWCRTVPELQHNLDYIKGSQKGYLFDSLPFYKRAVALSKSLKQAEGFHKVSLLFELLSLICHQSSFINLTSHINKGHQLMPSIQQTSIEKAIAYIYDHYQDDITLTGVADYASQNPSALCRAFKNKTGKTVFQFINRLRIEKACLLLRNNDLTVAQIAFQVGFNTFSHFSTQFQRIVHLSPTAYRKKINVL